MSRNQHPHAALICHLGGPRKLAELLGISSVNTVQYWAHRGVPSAKFAEVIRLADALRVPGVSLDRLSAEKSARVPVSDPVHGAEG